eukprot:scaffold37447_cov41-Phaeocystis_antarctica.AAC.1
MPSSYSRLTSSSTVIPACAASLALSAHASHPSVADARLSAAPSVSEAQPVERRVLLTQPSVACPALVHALLVGAAPRAAPSGEQVELVLAEEHPELEGVRRNSTSREEVHQPPRGVLLAGGGVTTSASILSVADAAAAAAVAGLGCLERPEVKPSAAAAGQGGQPLDVLAVRLHCDAVTTLRVLRKVSVSLRGSPNMNTS